MINEKIIYLINDLPVMPEIITLLIIELNSEDPDIDNIEKLIYKDPFITAKIINIANSTFFNLFRKVDNVDEALRFIGLKKLFNIILMIGVSKSFKDIKDFDVYNFWQYTLNVSKLSQSLAKIAKLEADTALTIGLLHGIGEMILVLKMKDQIQLINKESDSYSLNRAEIQRNVIGFSYLDVSQAFMKQNKFSSLSINTIKDQTLISQDRESILKINKLSLIIYLAIWVVRYKSKNSDIIIDDYLKEIISELKINEDDLFNQDAGFWASKEDVAMII